MSPQQTIATVVSVVAVIFVGLLGVMYQIYQGFLFKSAFEIQKTINTDKLAGIMRVGRFGIFIGLWILLLIFNVAICMIVFGKCDVLNQMKLTSILYMGIVATTFVLIGMIPSLVEIFENTIGLFLVTRWPMSSAYRYNDIMGVFQSKLFPSDKSGISIPFDSILPMFNIHGFEETFETIDKESNRFANDKKNPVSSDTTAPAPSGTPVTATPGTPVEVFDFWFDYSKMCLGEEGLDDARQTFKHALFKLCFAKNNAGHFVWAYIATIVTILSVAAVR
jgi:hypothetical protein